VSHHILFITSSSTNASGKRWYHLPTAVSITCISQGSVSDSIKVRWPKLESLVSSFLLMSHATNYKNRPTFHGTIQKNKSGTFLCTTMYLQIASVVKIARNVVKRRATDFEIWPSSAYYFTILELTLFCYGSCFSTSDPKHSVGIGLL